MFYYVIIDLLNHKFAKSHNFRSPRCKKYARNQLKIKTAYLFFLSLLGLAGGGGASSPLVSPLWLRPCPGDLIIDISIAHVWLASVPV